MSNEKREQVSQILSLGQITFTASLMGETTRDEWKCDQWRITFSTVGKGKPATYSTDYFTGTGHRVPSRFPKDSFMHTEPKASKAPSPADVLYSLVSDADACNESFPDWAENYGYSSDSIKALNTYSQCCETAKHLARIFTREQLSALRETLQDY